MNQSMTRTTTIVLLLAAAVQADLIEFVREKDNTYRWSLISQGAPDRPLQHALLHMVSQTWRGTAWQHRVILIRPKGVKETSHALLIIGGGSWREGREREPLDENSRELKIGYAIATAAQMPVAYVSHVPFQPLFGGKHEDEIIAYTFDQFLRTGKEDWPLLLPMTRAAVRAMDTVQAFARQEWQLEISKFIVTGASKRGWTTWLAAAADPRVAAIAPMVIDVLNMGPQMAHQREVYGGYSGQISDYTELKLQDRIDTPEGRRLLAIVDPFAYRKRLTMPKLILLGTNDPYWTVDALNLYYDELPGEKYITYFPNAGHGLGDHARLVGNVAAFALKAAGELTFPKFTWEIDEGQQGLRILMRSDVPPIRVVAWRAASPTRDFRKAKWTSTDVSVADGRYVYELPRPESGYAAAFGEALFMIDHRPVYLTTNLRVIGSTASE